MLRGLYSRMRSMQSPPKTDYNHTELCYSVCIVYLKDTDARIFIIADDTKIANVANLNGCKEMQNDLDKLVSWEYEWQTEFKYSKNNIVTVTSTPQSRI